MLQITEQGDVLWLEGELDLSSAKALEAALHGRDGRPLIVDASSLSFMDSTGLRVLIQAAATRNGSGSLVLRNPMRPVRRPLDLAIPGGVPGLKVQT